MKKVLRFTASWCGPCKMLAKNLESIKTDLEIQVVDIDTDTAMAQKYGIRGVPTLIMLDGDKEVKRNVGVGSLKDLQTWFEK
jgi:thiol-disulfide isomerase/thioredoxin